MADIGLYEAKYALRRWLERLLPAFRGVDPNLISWSLVPVGTATGAVLWLAARGGPAWLYLAVVALALLRMLLGTLDGLVAVRFHRGTARGELVNRLAPELCDVLYLVALALARPGWTALGAGALATAWLTTFAGLLGFTIGKGGQSVGPVGQTDRLAALILFALLAFLGETFGWSADFLALFLGWCVLGGAVTILLRLARHFRAAGDAPREAR
jgi:CDP-diacylglycerol--glycerol-3-phosphate 3-phosphatidyltransferase